MTTFVAIYRGKTIANARLIAVSADPKIIADVSDKLLKKTIDDDGDNVVNKLENGRRNALGLIAQEATNAGSN